MGAWAVPSFALRPEYGSDAALVLDDGIATRSDYLQR